MRWFVVLMGLAGCAQGAAPAPTPVRAQQVGPGPEWAKVVIVTVGRQGVVHAVGDTIELSATILRGDVEGEHHLSCGAVWNSLDRERARFLHDSPDGRLIVLAAGSVTVEAACQYPRGNWIKGAITLSFSGDR